MNIFENDFSKELTDLLNKYKLVFKATRYGIEIEKFYGTEYVVLIEQADSATAGFYQRLIKFLNNKF